MKKINIQFFYVVFIALLALNLYIFTHLLNALLFGAILAGTFYPLFEKIQLKFKLSRTLASTLTCLIILLLIVLPGVYLVFQMARESINLYNIIREGLGEAGVRDFFFGDGIGATVIQKGLNLIGVSLTGDELFQMLLAKVQSYSGQFILKINSLLSNIFSFLYQFIIMMITIYGLFIEGETLKQYIFKLSPLPEKEEQALLDKFNQMNYVTMVGNGVGGLIQGGLAGLCFWIVGLPSVVLWSTLMVILAFIPLVGISIVTIPAGIYLILKGQVAQGIFVLVFCAIVSLITENWFKPKFIGGKVKVNSMALLFYILAGMGAFGMLGIFYGPLLCVLFLTIGELFLKNYLPTVEVKN
ncbi:MAG: AI-2E family transporter [Bdellovibrio sp.]